MREGDDQPGQLTKEGRVSNGTFAKPAKEDGPQSQATPPTIEIPSVIMVKIVDCTPDSFGVRHSCNKGSAASPPTKQQQTQEDTPSAYYKYLYSKESCVPDFLLEAPDWVQILAFAGFVLVMTTMIFCAVYWLVQWESQLSQSNNPPEPTTRPVDLGPRNSAPTPILRTALPTLAPSRGPSPVPTPTKNAVVETPTNDVATRTFLASTRTGFPTFQLPQSDSLSDPHG